MELHKQTGTNQKTTLRQPASTRWSSHYSLACSLLSLYKPDHRVLEIIKKGLNRKKCAEANGALLAMSTFQFVFILHLMVKVLCQTFQKKSQGILNRIHSISITKNFLCNLKNDEKWECLLSNVISFCSSNSIATPIATPYMSSCHLEGTKCSSQQRDEITIEHHYRYDIY